VMLREPDLHSSSSLVQPGMLMPLRMAHRSAIQVRNDVSAVKRGSSGAVRVAAGSGFSILEGLDSCCRRIGNGADAIGTVRGSHCCLKGRGGLIDSLRHDGRSPAVR
jgi:hypothetical protein